ncbi:hypothetical protein BGZ82_006337 [Podila clonocystis]|nr:hypothetical protein BGZ82_006337 [Podila clonocystis]
MKNLVEEMVELNSHCKYMFLLQHYCPVKVTSFVHAIIKHIVPLTMFGSTDNRDVVLRAMTKFIHLRKYESISLQYVLQGFKISACEWLQDSRKADPRGSVRHLPPSASEKQFEILCEFLYWLFDGFLMPLLQASFYVTDSSYQKNKMFYYRHELWRRILRPAKEIAECQRPFANVRFLPKTNDLRPIVNLRKKATKLVNGNPAHGSWSMNQTLSNAFLVLACERNRQSISSSAIGMSDLYHRLKQLKAKLVDPTQSKQSKLYFVKVDIQRSFDSINQDKLMEVIDKMLQERYSKIMPTNGQITKRFMPKALPINQLPNMQFLDYACNVAETSKHAVLVDKALLRLADDFLFVSRSKEKASTFLNVMAQGHPEYGCFINQHKTLTNFDVKLNGEPVQKCDRNAFPYCGYLLNTQTLDARVDFTRYKDEAMQHQCQMAFADTSFNSLQTVLLNVYQNFVFCAMKFHVYIQELVQDPVTAHHIQKDCLAAIVLDIFKVCYGLLHNGRRSTMGIAAGAKFEVAERHVKWLGATAFRTTLPAMPLYEPLKNVLKEQILVPLTNSEKSHFKRKLLSVVNDARNQIMMDIKYTVARQ